jgi:hypothetical protein
MRLGEVERRVGGLRGLFSERWGGSRSRRCLEYFRIKEARGRSSAAWIGGGDKEEVEARGKADESTFAGNRAFSTATADSHFLAATDPPILDMQLSTK